MVIAEKASSSIEFLGHQRRSRRTSTSHAQRMTWLCLILRVLLHRATEICISAIRACVTSEDKTHCLYERPTRRSAGSPKSGLPAELGVASFTWHFVIPNFCPHTAVVGESLSSRHRQFLEDCGYKYSYLMTRCSGCNPDGWPDTGTGDCQTQRPKAQGRGRENTSHLIYARVRAAG